MLATIHGVELHYEESGSGPTVLFLHDTSDNRGMIVTHNLHALAEAGFRTISTNLRGANSQAGDAIALLNYLGIGRAVIIGMAGGSALLLDLLDKYPSRVAAASFVLSRAQAKALTRQVNQHDLKLTLRKGICRDLQQALRQVLPQETASSSPGDKEFGAVRGWISRVHQHCRTGVNNCSTLLRKLDLPPLLLTQDESVEDDEILSDPI